MSDAIKRVLFFSKSAGFEHDTIKRGDNGVAPCETFMEAFGADHGYEVVSSKDGSLFTPEYLAGFDAFLFCTTGDLGELGHDQQPPFPAGGKEALLAAIAGGKGFVGVHNASDTYHAEGSIDPYIAMLGGEFATHGAQQNATQEVVDAAFPGLAGLPTTFETHDEWYVQRNYGDDLHVVLMQRTDGMTGDMYEGKPAFPATWARLEGEGRVFYISMGHRPVNWEAPEFKQVILAGLDWAVGRTDADVTPNWSPS